MACRWPIRPMPTTPTFSFLVDPFYARVDVADNDLQGLRAAENPKYCSPVCCMPARAY